MTWLGPQEHNFYHNHSNFITKWYKKLIRCTNLDDFKTVVINNSNDQLAKMQTV